MAGLLISFCSPGSNLLPQGCVSKMNGIMEQGWQRLAASGSGPAVWQNSAASAAANAVASAAASAAASDEELLGQYRTHGDRSAFEELCIAMNASCSVTCGITWATPKWPRDVFQQNFPAGPPQVRAVRAGRKLRPWLYAVATNQAIDLQRRQGRRRMASLDRRIASDPDNDVGACVELLDGAGPGPAEQSESAEQRDEVRRAVDALPEPIRQVINLVYYQGLKYREAATALSIPVGTVKSRLHAAILKLGETITPGFLAHDLTRLKSNS